MRPETIKLLEENRGRTLYDINQSKILYDPPPRVMEIKKEVNKWDLSKLKSFCTAKEIIRKVKRQPSEWEKTMANETSHKGLNSKIYTLAKERATHSSILAWRFPRTGAWWAAVYGVAQSQTQLT